MTAPQTLQQLERELAGQRRTEHGAGTVYDRARRRVRQTTARISKLKEGSPAGQVAFGSRFIPDTSEYTGRIDWPAVRAKSGVRRAIAKATQYRTDYQFDASWRGMRAAGFTARGAYHFFTEEPATVQARRLLAAVDAAGGLEDAFMWNDQMGPAGDFLAVDFEKAYAPAFDTRAVLEELVIELHQAVGMRVLLYTGGPFWNTATDGWGNDLGCILWHAAYTANPAPDLPACWHPALSHLWQYTDGNYGNRPHQLPGLPPCDISVTLI